MLIPFSRSFSFLIFFFILVINTTASVIAPVPVDTSSRYRVNYLQGNSFNIDGIIKEKAWEKCEALTVFISPWSSEPVERTEFRAAYDRDFFYFSFCVSDGNIITGSTKEELSVTEGDRVEIFFSHQNSLRDYYCIEISPDAQVLDYQAAFYRKFNYLWNIKDAVIKSVRSDNGYTVEGRLPLGFIKGIMNYRGSLKDKTIFAGIFRADKDDSISPDSGFTWLSWIDPGSDAPDFHIPEAMGILEFQ